MVISYNSQLGLRFKDGKVKLDFLTLMEEAITKKVGKLTVTIEKLKTARGQNHENGKVTVDGLTQEEYDYFNETKKTIEQHKNASKISEHISSANLQKDFLNDENGKYYFICESVYKAAELIRISDNFTGRTLKDVDFGKYTYLMGKHKMVRFVCQAGVIGGFYYDEKERICFEWGIDIEDGGYYFPIEEADKFSKLMQVLAFVELGDITVKMLAGGQNNGGKKDVDKITNTSKKTVYVVDSSWNQILIRTDGFAVRGHFRLQPCGEGMKDRKLIWIDAFEKHGYKRRPSAEIVR